MPFGANLGAFLTGLDNGIKFRQQQAEHQLNIQEGKLKLQGLQQQMQNDAQSSVAALGILAGDAHQDWQQEQADQPQPGPYDVSQGGGQPQQSPARVILQGFKLGAGGGQQQSGQGAIPGAQPMPGAPQQAPGGGGGPSPAGQPRPAGPGGPPGGTPQGVPPGGFSLQQAAQRMQSDPRFAQMSPQAKMQALAQVQHLLAPDAQMALKLQMQGNQMQMAQEKMALQFQMAMDKIASAGTLREAQLAAADARAQNKGFTPLVGPDGKPQRFNNATGAVDPAPGATPGTTRMGTEPPKQPGDKPPTAAQTKLAETKSDVQGALGQADDILKKLESGQASVGLMGVARRAGETLTGPFGGDQTNRIAADDIIALRRRVMGLIGRSGYLTKGDRADAENLLLGLKPGDNFQRTTAAINRLGQWLHEKYKPVLEDTPAAPAPAPAPAQAPAAGGWSIKPVQ